MSSALNKELGLAEQSRHRPIHYVKVSSRLIFLASTDILVLDKSERSS